MVYKETKLKVKDNSGAKVAQCIETYKKPFAKIGDIIYVSVKKIKNKTIHDKKKIEKGNLFKALIIRTKYFSNKTVGCLIKFEENSIILLNKNLQPVASRILGPITRDLRKKNIKILSISSKIK